MERTKSSMARLLAIAVFLFALVAAPLPANAAGSPAYLSNTLYLTANPNSSMAPLTLSRQIYLAYDGYDWTVGVYDAYGYAFGYSYRSLILAAGTYTWSCTLQPGNGTYTETCSLATPGHSPAYLTRSAFNISYTGTYTFSSSLRSNTIQAVPAA